MFVIQTDVENENEDYEELCKREYVEIAAHALTDLGPIETLEYFENVTLFERMRLLISNPKVFLVGADFS